MNVLSCFDGMSCGQIALNKAGIDYSTYYASEIDKYAIQVTQANYPNTVQLGDIRSVDPLALPKIDLLIGGSPCQGFSFAGKQLNFEDPRSKLFFDFVRLKETLKPKYFLLENVRMSKQSQDIISEYMGCEPVAINSALVSAQSRQRLYWTNIPFTMPEDKGIVLGDVLETGFTDRDKAHCIDANYFKGGNLKSYFDKGRRQLVFNKPLQVNPSKKAGGKQPHMQDRVFSKQGKSHALTASFASRTNVDDNGFRKLTPLECERLQTVPEGYTNHVSNTQRYKMLGNGWTVDVITTILEGINK
jgi:site-specific DNA-cytosine methylase